MRVTYKPDTNGIEQFLLTDEKTGKLLTETGAKMAGKLLPVNIQTGRQSPKSGQTIISTNKTRQYLTTTPELGIYDRLKPRQVFIFEVFFATGEARKPIILGMKKWQAVGQKNSKPTVTTTRKPRQSHKPMWKE